MKHCKRNLKLHFYDVALLFGGYVVALWDGSELGHVLGTVFSKALIFLMR